MTKEVFNPWEVKGDIDYKKLIKEFGIVPLKNLPDENGTLVPNLEGMPRAAKEIFTDDILFRRKFVFAARDIGQIITRIRDKKPFCVMTGLMPTGKFHIGHALVLRQVLFYQKLGATVYIAVADIEAYNARNQSLEDSKKIALEEYLANYIAMGLDLNKTKVYFQSDRSKDSTESNAYYRLQNLFSRHSTFNEVKGVYGEITPGKLMAALLQASDMYHPQLKEFEGKPIPTVIPVGIDQDPHIRLARGIARRFNKKFIPISSSYHFFLPGLKGGKMSASDQNSYVALTDTPSQVKNKINKYAFSGGQKTIEEHKKQGGNPDVDVSFQYLRLFEEDDSKLSEIYEKYKSGEMLTGELKKLTIEKINSYLRPIQNKYPESLKKVKTLFN